MDLYILEIKRRMCFKSVVKNSRPEQLGLHFASNISNAFFWNKIIAFRFEFHGYLFIGVLMAIGLK